MSFLTHTPNLPNLGPLFMRNPARYLPLLELVEGVMNGESPFSQAQRELIALHVSQINGCHYCMGSHSAVLKHLGADAQGIACVLEGSLAGVDPKMQPVLDFAKKLTLTPDQVGQADVDTVCQAGWTDQAIEDAVGVVSLFSFFNRMANGLGIEGSPEDFEQAGEMFAKQGYASIVKMVRDQKDQLAS